MRRIARKDRTRIGIPGTGMIGHALAVRFAAAGHEVMVSNSRGPDTLADVVTSIPGSVRAGTVAEAARFGELVEVAIPVQAIRDLPPEPFAGKIVIDANNYYPEPDARVPELDADETTSSELLASLLPADTVVKAFNTIYFRRLLEESRPGLPPSRARAPISISALVEKAASSDATPNAPAPIKSMRRRPIQSPSVPILTSEPASRKP